MPVGLLVILSPLLVARLLALGGWPLTPVAVVLVGVGFAVELLRTASGFGAMLINVDDVLAGASSVPRRGGEQLIRRSGPRKSDLQFVASGGSCGFRL